MTNHSADLTQSILLCVNGLCLFEIFWLTSKSPAPKANYPTQGASLSAFVHSYFESEGVIGMRRVFQLFTLVCSLFLLLASATFTPGQVSNQQVSKPASNQQASSAIRSVPSGSKMKFKGVVISRDADNFTIRDRTRQDYLVRITDDTSIKTYGGFFKGGKKYPVTDILRGLIVEVEGRGDSQGQLVADKIRFNESDMRAAVTADTRVSPVEANQERLAGQMDELYAVAAEARAEAANANERISSLDDYDMQESVAVTFKVNSAVLSPEAKRQLDDFAAKVMPAKAYMIEISGHTDSTGSEAKNLRLSQQRAESVVQYLAVTHKIPLRRFVTPMGYGKTEAVADNSTASGRAQNRRVEVKMMLNRGMSQQRPATSSVKP
jgi:outer membrane protein OmpA-like peptidoglycan-associated protein